MKPSSAKAKGRNFQNKVREMIMEKLGINEHDIKATVMRKWYGYYIIQSR